MANQKISQLPAATSTSGPDLYPLVQSAANLSITFSLLQSAILSSAITPISSAIPQITYSGSISGSAIYSMPFQGASYKKFLINLQSLSDAGGSITFPVPFVKQPYIYGDSAAIAVASSSLTALTLAPTSAISGNIFVEGY